MLVHFWETRDTASGVRVPIVGRLRFRRLADRIIPGSPDEAVRATHFPAPLDDDGKASVPLAEGYWEVSLYGDEAGWGPVYVAVGAGAEADWPDLVRVDPTTLTPEAAPEAAWWAAIEGVTGDIGQAVADYLVANPPTADVTMADLTGHAADTTAVHGIADTAALVVTTDARLSDARTPTAHTHTLADVTDYTAPDLSGYATTSDARLSDARPPLAHTHAIADTTGLQSAIDGKAATGHTHAELHTHANKTALDSVSGTNTGDQDLSGYATTASLATVATTGAYADLSNKPTIPDSADDISAAPASGQAAVSALTAAASVTVPATHSMHTLTMTQNTTLVFSNPTAGHAFTLKLSGAFTPTFPASVTWAGGSAPTYASGKVYVLATFDAGTSWTGSAL